MPSLNWNDLFENAETDEAPPPASTYLCEIETAKWTKSSTGKDMLKLRLRIVAGAEKGKALFTQIVISPDSQFALKIALKQLAAIGLTRAQLENLSDSAQEELVIGTQVQVDTEIDTKYDPKNPRAQVKEIKAVSGGSAPVAKAGSDMPPPPAAKPTGSLPSTPPPAPFSS